MRCAQVPGLYWHGLPQSAFTVPPWEGTALTVRSCGVWARRGLMRQREKIKVIGRRNANILREVKMSSSMEVLSEML